MGVEQFLRSLLDPEMFGHAVTAEVRDEVRVLLGMPRVETKDVEEHSLDMTDWMNWWSGDKLAWIKDDGSIYKLATFVAVRWHPEKRLKICIETTSGEINFVERNQIQWHSRT